MKFTQIPTDTFEKLQLNAGLLVKGATGFVPATGTVTAANIIGATTGGISVTCIPAYVDFGENVDNCPKNMMELKKLDNWECKISGTFLTVTAAVAKMMLGAADVDATDTTKVTPRVDLDESDFDDVWFVGDYSDKNGATNGGFVAVHLMNALSTGGFSLQTTDKDKGQFTVNFTGHVSIDAQDVVPMEFYIKAGTDEVPVTYTYTEATLTDGFVYGTTYYTRTGSGTTESPYVYTEVASGATYDDSKTYYTRSVSA